jgi:hypothetical protein
MYEGSAIENASKLSDIGFGEFTSNLIKDVFTALIDAEMTQMEAYKELVTVLSQSLSTYINNTQNDVSINDIEDLISGLNLPDGNDTAALLTAVNAGYATAMAEANNTTAPAPPAAAPVSDNAITALITTLGPIVSDVVNGLLPPSGGSAAPANISGTTTPATIFGNANAAAIPNYQAIYKAIAGKISNDKYTLLQAMVRTGLMRLVVDSGTIETRLTFDTYETHEDSIDTKHRDRTVTREKEKGGRGSSLMSNLIRPGKSAFSGNQNGKARAKQRGVVVNTAKTHHRDTAGSHVQVFGRVEIKFKTDYMPLSQQ